MNWGKGIIVGMGIFVLFITAMGIYMFRSPVDEYDHQYYEKGLAFNKEYDLKKQVYTDNAKPSIVVTDSLIKFIFVQPAKGTIKFIRPSATALDKTYQLNSGNGKEMALPRASVVKGQWQIELAWESNHKAYLYQQEIFIK